MSTFSAGSVPLIEQRLEGRVLIATLNRPEAANGINADMAAALEGLAGHLEREDGIQALVLTGKGRVFCSGGDVGAFKSALAQADGAAQLPALLDVLASRVHAALERIANAGPLLIAAVNGPATGAGLGLLCACDLAYARPGATLRAGFSRLRLSPDTATSYYLPRIIGYRRSLEMLLRGDAVTADAALQLGIYCELIDQENELFVDEVLLRVQALIASGPAVAATRRLLREGEHASLGEHLRREQSMLVGLAARPDVSAHIRKALGLE
ncbi:enoyl-CoA hydratase/isomerase family protein [Solimonas terrae]|uniref:Enoyl-CoA hydratase n=1 Tax=Solimonas terrae TaxID=1396819 RepID=A0A6M2BWN6_9GAMM|nr:enoyl-CoA hydratase-related protein [Solimonas terrae]NGY07052.1 hypothetical protein [Solimonas terrae]